MHRGVDPVGLSKLARGLGEIPELPGVDDGHRHPGESEGRSGGLLEPPGGFEYRQSATFSLRADGAPPSRDAPLVVGGLHVFPARPEHHVQAVLGSRSMPACRWVFPSSGCSPLLVALPCQCGLARFAGVPGNCSGSVGCEERDDPRYSTVSERSLDHGAVGLSRPHSRFYGHAQHTRGRRRGPGLLRAPALTLAYSAAV